MFSYNLIVPNDSTSRSDSLLSNTSTPSHSLTGVDVPTESILEHCTSTISGNFDFNSQHPHFKTHTIRLRKRRTVPRWIGPRIPSKEESLESKLELRALELLLALCPHSSPRIFYSIDANSVIPFFNIWEQTANRDAINIITNAENFHIAKRLSTSAAQHRKNPDYIDPQSLTGVDEEITIIPATSLPMNSNDDNEGTRNVYADESFTLDPVYFDMISRCDQVTAPVATNMISKFTSFPTSSSSPQLSTLPSLTADSISNGYQNKSWTLPITTTTTPATSSPQSSIPLTSHVAKIEFLTNLKISLETPFAPPPPPSSLPQLPSFPTITEVSRFWSLNMKQDAVFRALGSYLLNKILDPLTLLEPPRVIVVGEGGVGKSRIVTALKSLTGQYGYPDCIAIMAPSGIAAVAIGGMTCDALCKLRSDGSKIKASSSWDQKLLVILDEFSMCGQVKLAKIDCNLQKLKSNKSSFGGLGFVLMGDHFQQLPVKDSPLWAEPQLLSRSSDPKAQKKAEQNFINQVNGHNLYMSFNQCYYLTETNRFSEDPSLGWHLSNARYGLYSVEFRTLINSKCLTPQHWNTLSTLPTPPVIGTHANKFKYNIINAFITSRSTIQSTTSNPTYRLLATISPTKDRVMDSDLLHAIYNSPPNDCNFYHPVLDVYIGMPVLVTQNISVEIGIANGSQATVHDIVFRRLQNPNSTTETPVTFKTIETANGAHVLIPSEKPLYIVIKIENCNHICKFNASISEPGLFPIQVMSDSTPPIKSQNIKDSFRITQFPITPSFSLTDFKLQGKTLDSMIISPFTIDHSLIESMKITQSLTGPSLYVLLSRVRKSENLYICKKFTDDNFNKCKPLQTTLDEDTRLIQLAQSTKSFQQDLQPILTYQQRINKFQNPSPPTTILTITDHQP